MWKLDSHLQAYEIIYCTIVLTVLWHSDNSVLFLCACVCFHRVSWQTLSLIKTQTFFRECGGAFINLCDCDLLSDYQLRLCKKSFLSSPGSPQPRSWGKCVRRCSCSGLTSASADKASVLSLSLFSISPFAPFFLPLFCLVWFCS